MNGKKNKQLISPSMTPENWRLKGTTNDVRVVWRHYHWADLTSPGRIT